jgi:origin recognition complex subunit 4
MTSGQNNAALLMGARGCGKTMILNQVIRDLRTKYTALGQSCVYVHLNGTIQTDDTLAMREIVRQLCDELRIDKDKSRVSRTTFTDNLQFLVEVLGKVQEMKMPVIFILDEFHLFAERGKQTLLYNLSDLLQSSNAQLALVGMTPRLDAYTLLEKRVRSRISYRRILLQSPTDSKRVLSILKSRLLITQNNDNHDNGSNNDKKGSDDEDVKATTSESDTSFPIDSYNDSVCSLLKLGGNFEQLLSDQLAFGVSMRWCLQLMSRVISKLHPSRPVKPTMKAFRAALKHVQTDRALQMMSCCSSLELCMIAAMMHLEAKEIVPYNFEMTFHEYETFRKRSSSQMLEFSKPVCTKAFERLLEVGVLMRVDHGAALSGATGTAYGASMSHKHYQSVRLAIAPPDILHAFKSTLQCPGWLRNWAIRWGG